MSAWQLVDLRNDEPTTVNAGPFVGRTAELDALHANFADACREPGRL